MPILLGAVPAKSAKGKKNRFFEPIFLFDHPKGQVDPFLYFPFGLWDLVEPMVLCLALHQQQTPVLQQHFMF